jgi:hypothetical protein
MSRSREYSAWVHIRERCYRKSHKAYRYYGGRGIKVCDQWLHCFENFLADMGECPPGLTIERNNSNGDYEPGNCRWATRKDQNRNTKRNTFIQLRGEKKCISEWAEITGISKTVIRWRIYNGWSPERALTTPKERRTQHA